MNPVRNFDKVDKKKDISNGMNLPDTVFFKFIKQYPRVSALFGLILLAIFLFLPGSLEKRIKLLILSAVLGFFAALGLKYFLAKGKQ